MRKTSREFVRRLAIGVATAALLPGAAWAQDDPAPAAGAAPQEETELVVTGTLLRGTAPVGSNVIAVGEEKIQSTGASSSNELLATIPQVTNYFNGVPSSDLRIAVNQIQVSRPNLRGISPNNAASSATLILVDGHRIATSGISQASVDPDAIPPGAIERVEVVTEGGSATYGADAVAGVINFITRRRFDGLKVDARYGFADDYWQTDANVTAGKDWGSGSAFISYSFAKNDALFGRDRDYIRGLDYSSQPYTPSGRACDQANVSVVQSFFGFPFASNNYAYPGLVAGTFNACDGTDDATFVPKLTRHGVMAGLSQDLDDTTSIDVRAFYSRRETTSLNTFRGTVNVGASNFYISQILPPGVVIPPPGGPVSTALSVNFSFAPLVGRDTAPSTVLTEVWGTNVEVKKDLGGSWQLRGLLNYSRSNSEFELVGANATRLNAAGSGTTAATAINPVNIAATNPALVADILDNEIAGQARDDLFTGRLIADGSLFTMGGGDVKLAVGYEYMHDDYSQRYQTDIRIGTLGSFPYSNYDRDVHSFFGELQVPIFGADNAVPGISSLVLSASGRYDHYSDFGSTTNPKFGVTYKPVEWFTIRGNWGTSFTAPTPLDQLGSQRNTLNAFPFVAFQKPGDVLPGGITCCITLGLQGSQPNLKPQTATTWSVGFDIAPPFVQGFRASLSYYNVKFEDILATPTPNVGIFTNFPNNVIVATNIAAGLTQAQLDSFRNLAPNANATINALPAGRPVYQLVDFRTGNFGVLKVGGLDFSASYRRETGFGGFDLGVNGNYQLSRKAQVSTIAPVVDLLLRDNSKLQLQTIAGVDIGNFRAQATWNHTGGYRILPTTSVPVQTKVADFNTVNLFFKYDVPGESLLLKDLSLTLNINNVFDQDPPILLRNDQNENGYANGFTIGRLFMFGVSKKF